MFRTGIATKLRRWWWFSGSASPTRYHVTVSLRGENLPENDTFNRVPTLTDRILDYFDRRRDTNRNASITRLPRHLSTTVARLLDDRYRQSDALAVLDDEFDLSDLDRFEHELLLDLLHVYAKRAPHRIAEYRFYNETIRHLTEGRIESMRSHDLVRFIFYVGMAKKQRKRFEKGATIDDKTRRRALRNAFDRLRTVEPLGYGSLDLMETCAVCNATFKASLRLTKDASLERHVTRTIEANLTVCADAALFVALVKTIRQNRWQTDELLDTIALTILFNRTTRLYAFVAVCHLLALYADASYHDRQLFDALYGAASERLTQDASSNGSMNDVDRVHPTGRLRVKDLRTFLWSTCVLSYAIDSRTIDAAVEALRDRLEWCDAAIIRDADLYAESLYYLWLMNYRPVDLLRAVLTVENIAYVHSLESRAKQRLNTLLNFIQMEDIALYDSLKVRPLMNAKHDRDAELKTRPSLVRLYRLLATLEEPFQLRFSYGYAVPYLKLLGLIGYKRDVYKTVHVELIDRIVRLRGTKLIEEDDNGVPEVNGFMRAKLRVLDRMEEALLVVDESDLESMTDEEARRHLQEELRLLI